MSFADLQYRHWVRLYSILLPKSWHFVNCWSRRFSIWHEVSNMSALFCMKVAINFLHSLMNRSCYRLRRRIDLHLLNIHVIANIVATYAAQAFHCKFRTVQIECVPKIKEGSKIRLAPRKSTLDKQEVSKNEFRGTMQVCSWANSLKIVGFRCLKAHQWPTWCANVIWLLLS